MATNEPIQNLPPLTWGALDPVPCSVITTEMPTRLVSREYYGIDGEGHDPTGRRSRRVKARLFFVETIKAGLYTTVWPQWRDALLTTDRKNLKHPEFGKFPARVDGSGYEIASKVTRGVIVEVSWVESIDPSDTQEQQQTTSNADLESNAAEADQGMSDMGLDYPSGFDTAA